MRPRPRRDGSRASGLGARALVTGASAGIGAALARELASRGLDLVLVARDRARLDALARAVPTASEVLAADLTDPDDLAAVERRLERDPPVDVLVNDAGIGTYGRFHEADLDGQDRQVCLNVIATMRLTHVAARAMAARGGGAILLVSSLAAFQAIPDQATYAASKAFVTSFGQALHEELRPHGVRVTTVCPGYTHTEFHARAGVDPSGIPSLLWQDAETVARAALDALEGGRGLCVPGTNRVTAALSAHAPRAVTRRVARVLNGRIR